MKNVTHIFLVVIVVLSALITYLFVNNSKQYPDFVETEPLPTDNLTNIDTSNCITISERNLSEMVQVSDMMRKYLAEKENIPLNTMFEGKMISGTKCFYLKIQNLGMYEDKNRNLVIYKDGSKLKEIPEGDWRN